MDKYLSETVDDAHLAHYGVLGMKWGIRRYQPYPKGEGHKGRFIGEKAKGAAKATGRVVTRAATGAKNRVVKAKQAYDAKAPEREARKAERQAERAESKEKAYKDALERKAARNIKDDVLRNPEKMSRMSAEELQATYDRLYRMNEAKKLSETVNHPNAERWRKLQDRILNRVADTAVDKAFAFVEGKMAPKDPMKDALTRSVDIAELNARYAQAQSKIAVANKTVRDKNADLYGNKAPQPQQQPLQQPPQQQPRQVQQPQKPVQPTQPTPPPSGPGTGVRGMKWGVREVPYPSNAEKMNVPKSKSEARTADKAKKDIVGGTGDFAGYRPNAFSMPKDNRPTVEGLKEKASARKTERATRNVVGSENSPYTPRSTISVPKDDRTSVSVSKTISMQSSTVSMVKGKRVITGYTSGNKLPDGNKLKTHTSLGTKYVAAYKENSATGVLEAKIPDARYKKGYRVDRI